MCLVSGSASSPGRMLVLLLLLQSYSGDAAVGLATACSAWRQLPASPWPARLVSCLRAAGSAGCGQADLHGRRQQRGGLHRRAGRDPFEADVAQGTPAAQVGSGCEGDAVLPAAVGQQGAASEVDQLGPAGACTQQVVGVTWWGGWCCRSRVSLLLVGCRPGCSRPGCMHSQPFRLTTSLLTGWTKGDRIGWRPCSQDSLQRLQGVQGGPSKDANAVLCAVVPAAARAPVCAHGVSSAGVTPFAAQVVACARCCAPQAGEGQQEQADERAAAQASSWPPGPLPRPPGQSERFKPLLLARSAQEAPSC